VWRSVAIVVAFLAAGVALYIFFIRTALGQNLDASSFAAVVELRKITGPWADGLRLGIPEAAGVLLLVLLIIALVHRRLRGAFAAVALSVITLALSEGLKDVVVVRPFLGDFGYAENTFPSGHTAVTVSVLIGCYWLLPDRLRRPIVLVPLVILGAAGALFQVVAYAHRPSDVFGGALLVGAIAACFLGEGGGLGVAWRWIYWSLVVVSAAAGALCLIDWQLSDYATAPQPIGTTGILLCAAACVGAAMIVGAERTMTRRPVAPARSMAIVSR
jgi:membrane-associated phospholipid phosphatase